MLHSGKNTPRIVLLLSKACSIVEVNNMVVDLGQEVKRIHIFEWNFVCSIRLCNERLLEDIHNNKAAGNVE